MYIIYIIYVIYTIYVIDIIYIICIICIWLHAACQLSPGTRDYNNVASGLMSKKSRIIPEPLPGLAMFPRVSIKKFAILEIAT